jgi:hypothetical protein
MQVELETVLDALDNLDPPNLAEDAYRVLLPAFPSATGIIKSRFEKLMGYPLEEEIDEDLDFEDEEDDLEEDIPEEDDDDGT